MQGNDGLVYDDGRQNTEIKDEVRISVVSGLEGADKNFENIQTQKRATLKHSGDRVKL